MLLVRAAPADLEVIEKALDVLNAPPRQVLIEAKFVEITSESAMGLGFDWFLGHALMAPAPNTNAGHAANQPLPGAGLMTDPQLTNWWSVLALRAETNGVVQLRGDQLNWPGRQATNAANVRVTAALGMAATGLLTAEQYRLLTRALEQRGGVDILAMPRVTTLDGRQAQLQAGEQRSIATSINPQAAVGPGVRDPGKADTPLFAMERMLLGPSLDVLPYVAPDQQTIRLAVTVTVTEFLGYDEPPKDGEVRVWGHGRQRLVHPPRPRFRVRQAQTTAVVPDGQTLLLGSVPVEATQITKDKVPLLGEIPLLGAVFRSEATRKVQKRLLVFLTPRLIDPAGNPLRPY